MSHSKHNSVVTLPINGSTDCLSILLGFFFCWLGEMSTARHLMGSGHNIYHKKAIVISFLWRLKI